MHQRPDVLLLVHEYPRKADAANECVVNKMLAQRLPATKHSVTSPAQAQFQFANHVASLAVRIFLRQLNVDISSRLRIEVGSPQVVHRDMSVTAIVGDGPTRD